jgi:glutathione S-transferase
VQFSPGGFRNPFAMPVPSFDGVTLYAHPISMFSRPIRLFVAESGLKIREEIVDLAKGAHHGADYTKKNPSQMVPMLEEGGFRLTESAAILKYLAERANSPAYPSDPVRRAKIDEVMDWLNTQFYREWGHNLCLPQIFPHLKRRSDEAHAGTIEWGKQNSQKWLQVLNDHWIGNNQFLVGNRLTIADYFGSALVTLGEVVQTDFSKYPNVERWLNNMKGLKHWAAVNEAFDGFVAAHKGKAFETV